MLKKVFKYDFLSVWRVWWMAAIGAFASGLMGGFLLIRSGIDKGDLFPAMEAVSGFGILGFGMTAFCLLTAILLCVRYYKNFFTDEGYLTFTLPVSRKTHFASKVLCGGLYTLMSAVVIGLTFLLCLGMLKLFIPDSGLFAAMAEVFGEMTAILSEVTGGWVWVYGIEAALFLLGAILLNWQYLYLCITLGGVSAKKHKVIAAIGIYYGSSLVLNFITQILTLVGIPLSVGIMEVIAANPLTVFSVFAGLGFLAVAIEGALVALLWLWNEHLLCKKLNLE